MDPGTVDVKHYAKVNGYTAHNSKTVDKGPVGGVQRDLSDENRSQSADNKNIILLIIKAYNVPILF